MLAGYSEKINLNKSNRRSIVADLMDVARMQRQSLLIPETWKLKATLESIPWIPS